MRRYWVRACRSTGRLVSARPALSGVVSRIWHGVDHDKPCATLGPYTALVGGHTHCRPVHVSNAAIAYGRILRGDVASGRRLASPHGNRAVYPISGEGPYLD